MAEDIHWFNYERRFQSVPACLPPPAITPGMCVCIPVYAEPDLITTFESLLRCDLPDTPVEVLLLFNRDARMSTDEIILHDQVWNETNNWIHGPHNQKQGIIFLPIYIQDMPGHKSGVGLARKLVMDEAARRLDQHGIILCLDADCTVERNYLNSIYHYFENRMTCNAASIYFEHPLKDLPEQKRDHIVQYELHLRYLVQALKWTGHPFAYHTVGSAMAVRRNAYLMQGGMNSRQAGEDFYFLQKFIETDTLRVINTTSVYPSARISARVPFGTSRAMGQLEDGNPIWLTTSFLTFVELKPLFANLPLLYHRMKRNTEEDIWGCFLAEAGVTGKLARYLESIGFYEKCLEISKHTSSEASFRKRFFRYFNAFSIIRYTHWMRDRYFPDIPVTEAAVALADALHGSLPQLSSAEDYLHAFRKTEKLCQD